MTLIEDTELLSPLHTSQRKRLLSKKRYETLLRATGHSFTILAMGVQVLIGYACIIIPYAYN